MITTTTNSSESSKDSAKPRPDNDAPTDPSLFISLDSSASSSNGPSVAAPTYAGVTEPAVCQWQPYLHILQIWCWYTHRFDVPHAFLFQKSISIQPDTFHLTAAWIAYHPYLFFMVLVHAPFRRSRRILISEVDLNSARYLVSSDGPQPSIIMNLVHKSTEDLLSIRDSLTCIFSKYGKDCDRQSWLHKVSLSMCITSRSHTTV